MVARFERFANVRREEVGPLVAAAVYFFCVLTSNQILRPARDALGMQDGMDELRWLFMVTLVLTLLFNPLFGLLVSRYRRIAFVATTYLFFGANLLVFYALLVLAPQGIGLVTGYVFYVWQAVFTLFLTMVFWAVMADRFSLEQSKRLFPVIAVGGTLGALFGPALAALSVDRVGTPGLLLISAGFLVVAVLAAWTVMRLQPERTKLQAVGEGGDAAQREDDNRAVIGGSAWQGFGSVFRSKYLLGIAGFVMITTILATYVYFTRLQMVAALGDDLDMRTGVLARIDFLRQGATFLVQALIAGHVIRRFGVPFALTLLPITAAFGFVGLAIVGGLAAFLVLDVAFAAVHRGITRPARETLWTIVGREEKYKAKAFIDTFVYRGGDAVGAPTEGLVTRLGGLAALSAVVAPLAIVFGALGIWLGLTQRRIVRERALAEVQPAEPEPAIR